MFPGSAWTFSETTDPENIQVENFKTRKPQIIYAKVKVQATLS